MSKYRVEFRVVALVDADSESEAREQVADLEDDMDEMLGLEITSVEEVDD